MKKFLTHICLGVLVFCGLWLVAEYIYGTIDIQNDYSYKYKHVKGNTGIKTLLIGHSHFENGVNPYLLGDSVFDFAISGRCWIYWDVELAKQLYHTMPNLKTVIFPLGYEMPYESYHNDKIDEYMQDYIFMYSRHMHTFYDRFPEKYVYSSALLHNRMGFSQMAGYAVDSLGYMRQDSTPLLRPNYDYPDTCVFNGAKADLNYREYRDYLIQLAKICYDNQIRFIVVTAPCADCYVGNVREQGIHNLYALIDSVAVDYPIEYYNYIDDIAFRSDSLYTDGSHLNAIGADLFSIRLKNDLHIE